VRSPVPPGAPCSSHDKVLLVLPPAPIALATTWCPAPPTAPWFEASLRVENLIDLEDVRDLAVQARLDAHIECHSVHHKTYLEVTVLNVRNLADGSG
jgi:hypothetical protein